MDLVDLFLVTIVGEAVLETSLTNELLRLGATGYTVTDSRGRGSRGMRSGEIPGEGVRIEVIAGEAVADHILDYVRDHYFPHYGVIAWRSRVSVVRGDKYVSEEGGG